MAQYKLIAIVGEAGSGKDSLAEALVEQLQDEGYEAHEVVSYTTRPKRDYEIEGKDYHFVSPEAMVNLIMENKMIEAAEFNDWIYGTCIDDFDIKAINIEVLNPEGIEYISMDNRIDMCIIQCVCNEKERLIRQLNRELDPNIDEIIRRLGTDRRDFLDFRPSDYSNWNTLIYTDTGMSISEETELALSYVQQWTKKDNK